jgi:oligo-1,6-glucosidase
MQWDGSRHAGFTTGTPWMAVNPNHDQINADKELADPHSVYHHYRRLIALRHTEPVVVHGDFTMLLPDHKQVYAFTRRLDAVELLVLGNFSGDIVTIDLPDGEAWAAQELLVANYPPAPRPSAPITLRPWEVRVHRRQG